MTISEHCIESINNKLTSLSSPDSYRFTPDDFTGQEFSPMAASACSWLLRKLRYYDNSVMPVSDSPDVDQVIAALSSRMPCFVRDESVAYRLVDYLCTHLQAERMAHFTRNGNKRSRIEMSSDRGKILFQLDRINRDMRIDVNAADETQAMHEILPHFSEKVKKVPRSLLTNPPPVLKGLAAVNLSPAQKSLFQRVAQALIDDFALRRGMLLKRLDVTMQSFMRGGKVVGREDEIVSTIDTQRRHLSVKPTVYTVSDVLSTPVSILHEHSKRVTGSESVGSTAGSFIKKVMIGRVPDRGGRPLSESRAKAAISRDMGRGGGRGGHGGRSGGRGHGGGANAGRGGGSSGSRGGGGNGGKEGHHNKGGNSDKKRSGGGRDFKANKKVAL